MFGIIVFSVLSVTNAYIYLRLRAFIKRPRARRIFTFVYVILLAVLLGAEFLAHSGGGNGIRYVVSAGYQLLAYWFYLLLVVILFDLFGFAIRRITRLKVRGSRRFEYGCLTVMLVLPALMVLVGWMGYSKITIAEYPVEIKSKTLSPRPLRIAVASDFHLNALTDQQFMPRFVEAINQQHPDLVLLLGDVVEGDRQDADLAPYAAQFRNVRSRFGVYAVLGNHEMHGLANHLDFFKKADVEVLADAGRRIDDLLYLIGRNDRRTANRKTLTDLLKDAPDDLPVIVMDHRPEGFTIVSESSVSLHLSGHTHNGQLYPFNYLIGQLYDLGWGYKKIRDTHFFVTSGIRGWGPQVRTAGRSEIMMLQVTFKN